MQICPNNIWISDVINLIQNLFPENLPNCNLKSMGINIDNTNHSIFDILTNYKI
jgi:hypothetical protein